MSAAPSSSRRRLHLTLAPLTDERDIQRVAALEAASYPADEAASEPGIRFRQQNAGAFFQTARLEGEQQLVGFVNGTLSSSEQLEHESMSAHDPEGSLLCIHSVMVDGAFRRRGIASDMLQQYVRYICEQQPQAKRIALIAKAYLVGFYVSCGFAVTKLSPVVHGKDPWFELVLDCDAARQIPIVQVDSFTSEPFQGNPAAVVLLSPTQFHRKSAPEWMQHVAREKNLSETAFVAPRPSADNSNTGDVVEFDLKWFSPEVEVALCGHGTLATAVFLLDTGRVLPSHTIHFHTLSGVLVVGFEHAETTGKYLVSMDFPIIKLQSLPPADFPLDEVAAALGIPRAGILDALLALPDVLVHVDANNFASLTPDLPRLARMPARAFAVTTQVALADRAKMMSADFRSRVFAPRVGVDEDPVTGSAHCELAPFWSAKLGGNRRLTAYQSTPVRGGRMSIELPEEHPDRVLLKGEGVIVLCGWLASSP